MSTTTMSATVPGKDNAKLLHLLADYAIHSSNSDEQATRANPNPISNNPPDWPDNHHAIPPYRPINRHLDRNERPDGSNPIEKLFIFTMLNGCGVNAGMAKLWRTTGGKVNDQIFRYPVGGEK